MENAVYMRKLFGIIPAIVTPVDSDERFNQTGMREIIENVIKNKAGGILVLGTTGEPSAWTFEEKNEIVKTAVECVAGRVPVIVGCGAPSTRETVRLCKMAEENGADIIAVVTPYYITPTEEDLYEHYSVVAASTSLPVMAYNIPARTGICLPVKLVERLKDIPNIIGIKDSSGNFDYFSKLAALNDDGFQVIQGIDKYYLDSFKLGVTAGISGPANSIIKNQTAIYEAYSSGNIEEAEKYQSRFMKFKQVIDLAPGPTIAKEAANIVGLHAGPPVRPLRRPEGEVYNKLFTVLKEEFSDCFVK